MIKNENEAYGIFAKYLMNYLRDNKWDKMILDVEIYGNMIRSFEKIIYKNQIIDDYRDISTDISNLQMDAVFFLRKYFIELTGDRIWGLTFTLYPNGKFEVEYDYNKPDDYEESDDVITGEEINKSLSQFAYTN